MSTLNTKHLLSLMTALLLCLVMASPAGAYSFWKGSHEDRQTEIWVNPNCLDYSAGSIADQVRSVVGGVEDGGVDGWAEQAASGWLGFCFAGTTTVDQVDVNDGINLVTWLNVGGNGAVALTYCNGYTVDDGFDIVLFDVDRIWTHDLYPGGTDIKGVITHESGHALGLGHSGEYEATMWPYLKGNGTANRVLNDDDRMGMRVLYGFGTSGGEDCLYEAEVSENDICETALDLLPGDMLSGDTIWALNDYDPGAGGCTVSAMPGPDAVYRISLGQNEQIEVLINPITPEFDAAIYLLSGCGGDSVTCLAGADTYGSGGDESLSYLALEAGDYFLVVDSSAAGGLGSSGRFVVSTEVSVGSSSTVLASLQCSTTASTLPCGINLTVQVHNLTAQTRQVAARIDLSAAGGQQFNSIRAGSITIGAGEVYSRDLAISFPAIGLLSGSNSFFFTVDDTTPGDPSPVAGDRSEDTCSVITTLE